MLHNDLIERQLLICQCFAKRLADELGVTVYAPKTKIYVYENGVLKTLRDGVRVDAEYNRFEPYEK